MNTKTQRYEVVIAVGKISRSKYHEVNIAVGKCREATIAVGKYRKANIAKVFNIEYPPKTL